MRSGVTSFGRVLAVAGSCIASVAVAVAVVAGDAPTRAVDVSGAQPTASGTLNMVMGYGNAAYAGQPDDGRQAGIASTGDGGGYWVVNRRGAVYSYGNAQYHGGANNYAISAPIVGIAARPQGDGYWLATTDGAVFSFGGAPFFGSLGGIRLNQPIVGIAATKTGNGYWMVASDGGIFAFGDAPFYGSTGGIPLNQPVVGMAAGNSGYWLVASDGGIFSFNEPFFGSTGGIPLVSPVVGMARTSSGNGYWLAAGDGGLFTFGDAPFLGSGSGFAFLPVSAMAARPQGDGYWLLATPPGPPVNRRVYGAPPPPSVGNGKRVIYCNSCQRVWLIDSDTGFDVWVDSYLVSGRPGWPAPGTYGVQRRLNPGYTENGVRLDYFVGFAWGTDTDVGFHAIPISPSGQPLQTEAELGQFRSHGCVRQAASDARIMWDFAQPGTQVVVLP
jgi:hypothetical protein